jgi:hypothetical protein
MPALLLSIALHVGLLYLLSQRGGGGEEGGNGRKQQHISVKILDKPSKTETKNEQEKIPEDKGIIIEQKKKLPPEQIVVDHKCEESYEGIGIQFDYMSTQMCKISHIAKGYPADRAGLKVGDLLLSDAKSDVDCPGRGPIGSLLTLQVVRGGKHFEVTLVREKICTSPEETP